MRLDELLTDPGKLFVIVTVRDADQYKWLAGVAVVHEGLSVTLMPIDTSLDHLQLSDKLLHVLPWSTITDIVVFRTLPELTDAIHTELRKTSEQGHPGKHAQSVYR